MVLIEGKARASICQGTRIKSQWSTMEKIESTTWFVPDDYPPCICGRVVHIKI